MFRRLMLCILLLALALSAFAVTITVKMNGKTITVPAVLVNGKPQVDLVAFLKLLGNNAIYNAATKTVTVGVPASSSGSTGTAQLPGDEGQLGQLYTLRKDRPLYFCLLSAEYTTVPVVVGEQWSTPKSNEKFLLLHYTIQNPNKTDELVRSDSLRFIAVDAMNVNHEFRGTWGNKLDNSALNMQLKPAQKVEAYLAIAVPAKGPVPKLIVQPNDNGPVLRYFLYDDRVTPPVSKVASLATPIADPKDPTGATALESVPAQFTVSYPFTDWYATVEKVEYTNTPLMTRKPEKDGRFAILTILVKNVTPRDNLLRFDTFRFLLTSTDGENLKNGGDILFATGDRSFNQPVKAGAEMRIRTFFYVPKDVTPKTLTMNQNNSREYRFELP